MTHDTNIQTVRTVEHTAIHVTSRRIDGRMLARKLVGGDKVNLASGGQVTQAGIANGAVGQAQLKYEQVTLAFGSGDTVKTTPVTSGDVIIGVYSSIVTSTPAYGELQLAIGGSTLTGTRSAAPGGAAAITYTITLLKA